MKHSIPSKSCFAIPILSLFFLVQGAFLVPASAADDDQYWNSMQITSNVNEKFSIVGEVINRYSQTSEDFVTQSVRLGAGYKLTEKLTYIFMIENRTTNKDANDEQRYINQLNRKVNFDGFDLGFRGRWELREFSDSERIQNRFRALARIDAKDFKFGPFTPFAASEFLYVANSVGTRPEGSSETRHQLGVFFELFSGQLELSFMDRTQFTPEFEGNAKTSKSYSVINTVFKWSF